MSFRVRLVISFTLLIAITFGVGGTFLISTSFQSVLNEEKEAAMDSFETVQNNLNMLILFSNKKSYENMADLFVQMEEQEMARWQAISLTTEEQIIYEGGSLDLLCIDMEIPDSNQYGYKVESDEMGQRLQLGSKLYIGTIELQLNASYDLSDAYTLLESQQRMFLVIYGIVILSGVVMAGILSFVLTRRLKNLTTAVRDISEGDLSKRSKIRTQDEFGQLSRDFDVMADKLQNNIQQLELDVQRKEEFMGAFAHELKTPMTSIIGYADLLRQNGLNENDKMLAANYIFSEGKRLEKLSFKLLELLLVEKDGLSMKEVNLHSFLKNTVQALSPMVKEKNVRLAWKCESVKVILEPDLVKYLINNLVDNAVKAMNPEGGGILIKGRAIAGGVELQVIDNGCGMEEEELTRITEAFYRVDKSRSRAQGGAGLGLSLCKKIVDLHRGNMTFRSIKGKGSCVIVTLYGSKEDIHEET